MQKRVNAYRILFQRTKHDENLREDREKNYEEAKRTYQTEIIKEKLNSWKEYKLMVTNLQTGSWENTIQKYNNYPTKTR